MAKPGPARWSERGRHTYYLVMLAPAAAALAGIGVAALWQAYRRGGWVAWLLPLGLLATALWQVNMLGNFPDWGRWLIPLTFGGSVLAAIPLAAIRLLHERIWRRVGPGLVAVGLLALLVAPLAWSATPLLAAGNGTLPEAGPPTTTGRGGFGAPGAAGMPGETANSGLITYLEANRDGAFYLVAVASANQASPIALATGQPVLAMGGFTGNDPAMTAEKLAALVVDGQVRFVLSGGGLGRSSTGTVSSWLQASCTAVDASQYGGTGGATFGGPGGGSGQLYDCAAR
jgi:4-amino-4-deoxy-L-arabinose transferase-like glycosyltransferase